MSILYEKKLIIFEYKIFNDGISVSFLVYGKIKSKKILSEDLKLLPSEASLPSTLSVLFMQGSIALIICLFKFE